MNFNKKSTPPNGIPQPFNRPAGTAPQLKPLVAQLKTGVSAQSGKRPVAPPVYQPKPAPKIVAPKLQGAVQIGPRVLQAKSFSAPAKIANSIRPVTTKSTAFPFSAIQMAKARARKAARAERKAARAGGGPGGGGGGGGAAAAEDKERKTIFGSYYTFEVGGSRYHINWALGDAVNGEQVYHVTCESTNPKKHYFFTLSGGTVSDAVAPPGFASRRKGTKFKFSALPAAVQQHITDRL